MRSLHTEARFRIDAETPYLLATTVVLALLLVASSGISAVAIPALALVVAIPAVTLSLCLVARRWRFHCLHMSVCAVLLGCVGVLVGARLDFGQSGLMTIADLCRALQPFSVDAIRAQVASAPWTYAGMVGGCNLGMALSTRSCDRAMAIHPAFIPHLICCNAGMILGMFLTNLLPSGSYPVIDGVPAAARLFVIMALGMTAGMWGGWWLAELVLRGWRR